MRLNALLNSLSGDVFSLFTADIAAALWISVVYFICVVTEPLFAEFNERAKKQKSNANSAHKLSIKILGFTTIIWSYRFYTELTEDSQPFFLCSLSYFSEIFVRGSLALPSFC